VVAPRPPRRDSRSRPHLHADRQGIDHAHVAREDPEDHEDDHPSHYQPDHTTGGTGCPLESAAGLVVELIGKPAEHLRGRPCHFADGDAFAEHRRKASRLAQGLGEGVTAPQSGHEPVFRGGRTAELLALAAWARETGDGSRADLDALPTPAVWDEVASDASNCMGRACPTHQQCFYYAARRRVWHAQVLVVNHALYFADLSLRRAGVKLLPDHDIVVFDEAHMVESVASEHLGLTVSSGGIERVLSKLHNERTHRGLLAHYRMHDLEADVRRCRRAADALTNDAERHDLLSLADRLTAHTAAIASWLRQQDAGTVWWVEAHRSRRGRERLTLASAPVDVGATLRRELFDRVGTVVLASATLAVEPPAGRAADDAGAAAGNAFAEYQLPEAVLKLKQGFGRLIRTREDTGTVVILDPRVLTKPYGRVFLESLPPAAVEIEPGGRDRRRQLDHDERGRRDRLGPFGDAVQGLRGGHDQRGRSARQHPDHPR